MEEIYFVHRIRRTGGIWDKGIEVKDARPQPEPQPDPPAEAE